MELLFLEIGYSRASWTFYDIRYENVLLGYIRTLSVTLLELLDNYSYQQVQKYSCRLAFSGFENFRVIAAISTVAKGRLLIIVLVCERQRC